MTKIALLEDEPEWASAVIAACSAQSWQCTHFDQIERAVDALEQGTFDCLIADIHLGDQDGMALVTRLRQSGSAIPILMVTQFAAKYRAAASLDYGADDYLAKPFDKDELCARVRALLRRTQLHDPGSLRLGPLHISRQYRTAFWHGERLELRGQGFDILALLAEHDGAVVSQDMLWAQVWTKWDRLPMQVQPIQAGISRLRKDIAAVTDAPVVVTVPGRGYRLNAV